MCVTTIMQLAVCGNSTSVHRNLTIARIRCGTTGSAIGIGRLIPRLGGRLWKVRRCRSRHAAVVKLLPRGSALCWIVRWRSSTGFRLMIDARDSVLLVSVLVCLLLMQRCLRLLFRRFVVRFLLLVLPNDLSLPCMIVCNRVVLPSLVLGGLPLSL